MRKCGIVEVAVGCILATQVCGCATLFKGKSDEVLIRGVMGEWKAAMVSQDLEGIMAAYSEDYEGRRGSGKKELREFISRLIDEGRLSNYEIKMEEMAVSVDEETAAVGPVEFVGSQRPWRFHLELQKEEDNQWRIVRRPRDEENTR